jgi:hypothetical protein
MSKFSTHSSARESFEKILNVLERGLNGIREEVRRGLEIDKELLLDLESRIKSLQETIERSGSH